MNSGKAEMSGLEMLAAGEAMYARLQSYSRLTQREALNSPGLPPGEGGGGVLVSASAVPHCSARCIRRVQQGAHHFMRIDQLL